MKRGAVHAIVPEPAWGKSHRGCQVRVGGSESPIVRPLVACVHRIQSSPYRQQAQPEAPGCSRTRSTPTPFAPFIHTFADTWHPKGAGVAMAAHALLLSGECAAVISSLRSNAKWQPHKYTVRREQAIAPQNIEVPPGCWLPTAILAFAEHLKEMLKGRCNCTGRLNHRPSPPACAARVDRSCCLAPAAGG